MTILENNCMQSTASSAGYSTGGTLISAFAAFILLNNTTLPLPLMFGWVFFLAVLGVTMAIPMKRQMINIEQLRFPSGVAAAETRKALHSHGDKGMRSAQALGIAGLLAAFSKFWSEGLTLISGSLESFSLGTWFTKLNTAVVGAAWMGRTVMFSWEPMFLAAGAITGVRVCVSMMIGGILCWMVFVPMGLDREVITLTVTERMPAIPADVKLDGDARLKKYASINKFTNSIKWEGIMTGEDRTKLLALSSDPWFQSTIERLYVRSQFQAHEPLAAMPSSLRLTGAAAEAVRYDEGKNQLVMPDLISAETYDALLSASDNEAYRKAVNALYARSSLPCYEPLWLSAPLAAMPKENEIPDQLAPRLVYDANAKLLLWRGPLPAPMIEKLEAINTANDPAFSAAVQTLAKAAQAAPEPIAIPDALAKLVRFDEKARALRATGSLPDKATEEWLKAVDSQPTQRRAVAALVAATSAPRAIENFRDLVAWTLWGGTACMVTSGLLAFALQWRSALRAFSNLGKMFGGGVSGERDDMDAIETPASWFVIGQIVSLIAISWLAHYSFGMPYWQSVLAVLLTFALTLVACRVTGETDTTPIGAMGKIMQLTFGVVHPAKIAGDTVAMNVNLMAANITAGAAGSSADLLTDLKSGYLLGAHPRKQFIAQFMGIFTGTLVTVLAFRMLVPNADALGTAQFPAPAAQTWKGVAEALSQGLSALAPLKLWSILVGGIVGIILPILGMVFPAKAKPWVPSAAGVGLAWVFNWYYALLFLMGALIGWFIEKRWPKAAQEYTFPVASGVIAGESLMGVALIFWENGPEMFHKIFG
ncbi:MAG: OPT/YSL family transporter [Planctomycetes bacterium]|nr:OPT/YSL family transporter [Planctomycetota bacterium]